MKDDGWSSKSPSQDEEKCGDIVPDSEQGSELSYLCSHLLEEHRNVPSPPVNLGCVVDMGRNLV